MSVERGDPRLDKADKLPSGSTSPSGGDKKGYKRINFFKGFLTTEKDWNEAELYHVEKRKLHNRLLHAPGVVAGQAGELKVVARARGDLSVEIQPGYAIDGQGNDLILWDGTIKNINPEEYRLPQTIYVVLRFAEELTDFIAYKENLEYKGHRRWMEMARVEISQTEPDIGREVELARIYLEKGATRIRDARDASDPKPNEIDLRFVPRAGVSGSTMAPQQRLRVASIIDGCRKLWTEYGRRQVHAGRDALQAANTIKLMNTSHLVDMNNLFECWQVLLEAQAEVAFDVDANHPTIAQKKEFTDFKRHLEILKGLLSEGKKTPDSLTNLFAYQTKATESAWSALGERPKVEEKKEEAPQRQAEAKDWEGAKTLPNLPNELTLEGITWVLVDSIDILDKESEEKHKLEIHDAKDSYRTRQKLKYPDGTVVEDTGRAHVGGYASFKVLNVTPGRPLAILRRMDYVYGDYELEMHVNGKLAGMLKCDGIDRLNRWRNWPFLVPADMVTEKEMAVKQVSTSAGRDVNMFRYWFYQPK